MKLAKILVPIAFLALMVPGCQGSVSDSETIDDPDPNPDPDPTPDPTPDPGNGRVTDGLVALYTFSEGSGTIVGDSTGSGYALTMENPEAFGWIANGGISIDLDSALVNPAPATHITTACQASNELTIEMWGRTNSYLQDGPARIITLSENANTRNFTLSQEYNDGISYADARLRSTDPDVNNNGTPSTMSEDDVYDGRAVHHVVYTRSLAAAEGLVWKDGNIAGSRPLSGDFSNWDVSYPLTIGNEPTLNRPWRGELYLVAIYCRALNATEIATNMAAGY